MKVSIVLIFLVYLGIAGCSTTEQVSTDVLEPAEFAFPGNVYSLAFFTGEPEVNLNTRKREKLDANPREELWNGIYDIADLSPRFNVNSIKLIEDYPDTIPKDSVPWIKLQNLSDSLNVDALTVFHKFELNDSLEREIVYDLGSAGYYFVYEVHANINWKIYYPSSRSIIHSHEYEEKYVWESLEREEESALRKLPEPEEAFASSAYWSGNDIGHMLFPYWVTEERVYFTSGNKYLREAKKEINQQNWNKAIALLRNNFKLNSEEMAYRAAHNIAYACEMKGEIERALEWAEKALRIKNRKITHEYIQKLEERRDKIHKVENQMPI